MVRAALTSRSWRASQRHSHSRTCSGRPSRTAPHTEHALDEANQRSTTTRSRPYHRHLYSTGSRSSRHAASEMARASEWLPSMLRTCRSSITIAWFSRTSRVVSLCNRSRRRSVIRAYTLAAFRRAFSRFADPRCFRASTRCARANRTRSRRSWRRLVTFSPVDNVTSDVIPASTPTTAPVGGASCTVTSHNRDTCQRPAASRDTVTVLGSAPSGRGRDQRIASGSVIFASVSAPSRKRNADRVYSADARERRLLLNVGYFACLPQKFANAVCRCRSPCCSGTDDTSPR